MLPTFHTIITKKPPKSHCTQPRVQLPSSPRSCLWSEKRSCHCWLSPWPEPQLSVVWACCCFQATLRCYSHNIPSTPLLPVLRSAFLCGMRCPIHKLFFRERRRCSGIALLFQSKSRSSTGAEMEWDQVTVATRRQLRRWSGVRSSWRLGNYSTARTNSSSSSSSSSSALLLRERATRAEELRRSWAVNKEAGKTCVVVMCVCASLEGAEQGFGRACCTASIRSSRIRA